ncbi:IS66 family insertion sequence element accessory protein TnpA, partial [Acetivibrio cellulolyticus]
MLYKEWEKLIREFEKSGKTQAQWCREKGLKI